jgi:hypothetical protein
MYQSGFVEWDVEMLIESRMENLPCQCAVVRPVQHALLLVPSLSAFG